MKFIHTSDWHLGRLFNGHSLLSEQALMLDQIVQLAEQHQAEALVIAGDIYDRSVPPAEAVAVLDRFLQTMTAQMPVIMISGNHDSSQRLAFGAQHMHAQGLHIVADLKYCTQPVCVHSSTGPVHFYGIPYVEPVQVAEAFGVATTNHDQAHGFLVDRIHESRTPKVPTVLISHCFVAGGQSSDSERPLAIGGAEMVSYQPLLAFDYVALGHLHGPQYRGAPHVRYSGSPLKYSFSEHHQQKSITLVELDAQGYVGQQALPLVPRRDLRILEGRLAQIIDQAADDPRPEDYLLVRLTDEQDLLEPLAQLRRVYPNVMQLERLQWQQRLSQEATRPSMARAEPEVFADFYQQVMGLELTEPQQQLLAEAVLAARRSLEAKP